jgi:hypothetical protein
MPTGTGVPERRIDDLRVVLVEVDLGREEDIPKSAHVYLGYL